MEAQRQSMQVLKRFERDAPHGALRDFCEEKLAQLGEQRDRQARQTVRNQQCNRHGQQRLLHAHAIDHPLEHDRHAHIGDLGHQQTGECDGDTRFVLRKIGQQ